MITRDQLAKIYPAAGKRVDKYLTPLNDAMDEFNIVSALCVAGFLAQVGCESEQLIYTEELASGAAYDTRADLGNTRPEAINIAKANNTTPGRFWKGHGLIQTTGYDNHLETMLALDIDCLHNPRLLCEPVNACRSAAWFWQRHDLNKWAEARDIDGMSDVINKGHKTARYGDAIGFDKRLTIYKRACEVLL